MTIEKYKRLMKVVARMLLSSNLALMTGCLLTPEMKARLGENALKEVRAAIDKEDYATADKKLKSSQWLFEGKDHRNIILFSKTMNICRKELAKENPDIEKVQKVWSKRPECPDFPWPQWFSDKDIEKAIAASKPQSHEIGKLYEFATPEGLYYSYTPVNESEIALLDFGYFFGRRNKFQSRSSIELPCKIHGKSVVAIVGANFIISDVWGSSWVNRNLKKYFENAKKGQPIIGWSNTRRFGFTDEFGFLKRNFKSIIIPEGVRVITTRRFWMNQDDLANIQLPNSLQVIEKEAFGYCRGLTNVVLGTGLREIGEKAFESCENLTTLNFGDKLESIGELAFAKCTRLTAINLPKSLTTLGKQAFVKCENVKQIKIEGNLKSIGDGAFGYTKNLKDLYIAEGVEEIQDKAFHGTGLQILKLPSSVKRIGKYGFSHSSNLEDVDIGGVETIDEEAFYGSSIKKIALNNVVNIKREAFWGTKLTSIKIPGSVRCIEEDAFDKDLETIDSDSTATGIDRKAVDKTKWWNEIKGLKIIGDTVLGFNADRESGPSVIFIPDGIRVIADYANLGSIGGPYQNKKNPLSEIELPQGIEIIGKEAFCEAPIKSIKLPNSVKYIGSHAFSECSIESIEIPLAVTEIGASAFKNCNIKALSIPSTVTNIGEEAFMGNDDMMDVRISSGVTNLRQKVFANCRNLKMVSIPITVKEIATTAFSGCSKIESISIPSDKVVLPSLFAESMHSIKRICIQEGSTVVPEGFAAAFPVLKDVVIPQSVTKIMSGAFLKCSALKAVSFEGKMPDASMSIFKGTPTDLECFVKKSSGWTENVFPVNGSENSRKVVIK